MNDRELLQLAAKAARLNVSHPWNAERAEKGIQSLVAHQADGSLLSTGWDPLSTDADAFRLMVQLELLVNVEAEFSEATDAHLVNKKLAHAGDPRAATRRVIVQAAAAIGEMLP